MRGDFDEDELDDDEFDIFADDEPTKCSDCGCDLETEYHSLDCGFSDDDLDDEEIDDDGDAT